MKCDYHTHPDFLHHPEHAEQFIQKAIAEKIDILYFTDHMPLAPYGPSDRIPQGKVKEYCARVRELADQYKGQIILRTGIEIDYDETPTHLRDLEETLTQGQFDLVLGSTHFGGANTSVDCRTVDRDTFAERYFRNCEKAIRSGYFDVVTHPDMFRWQIEWPSRFPFLDGADYVPAHHEDAIRAMFQAAQECKVRIEVNASMIYKAEDKYDFMDHDGPHPAPYLMNLAKEYDLRYSYASDAHEAKYVGAHYERLRNDPLYRSAILSAEEIG